MASQSQRNNKNGNALTRKDRFVPFSVAREVVVNQEGWSCNDNGCMQMAMQEACCRETNHSSTAGA